VLTSIRAKLGAVFIGFLLLGAGSVTATFVTVRAQAADACVINLAGRQRMLTQEMTKAVLGIARGPAPEYQAELRQAAYLFDRTLTALLDGGSAPYGDETVTLPPTTDTAIRAQLEVVVGLWDRFWREVETVQTAEPESATFAQAVREIESLSLVILQEMDQAVRLYEAAAELKLARLRAIQSLFFVSAVGLLFAGYLLTQRTIVNPVSALEAATRRIAGGDLESPVEVALTASGEVRALAQSFEGMCHELAVSRLELEHWAAELETRVERRTEQLAALFEVSSEISSKLEIQRVLELVVEKTRHLAGGAVAVLCLLDPSGEELTVAATSGPAEALATPSKAAIRGPALRAVHAREAVILHEGCDCHLLQPHFLHSHLAVPLCIGDRVLGVLCVGHREESRFGEEEARLLTLLANAGAIALENARLYEQAEQDAALAERERIVAEIHDGLAQTLGFLGLRLGAIEGLIEDEDLSGVPEHLTLMQRTVKQASHEARRMMAGLQASPHARHTLKGRLRQIVERFIEERGMEIELRVETGQPIREPPKVREQVVRVVLEALTNVHKHARPSRATVTLERHGGQAVVCVQDDGPGFDVNSPANGQYPFDKLRTPHFGLKVMETRAEWIGGELSVESAPGQGTTVTLRWPTLRQPFDGAQDKAQDTAA
jgi:two-component system nitrate/nitrite sensor histidine kinase NarX